MKEALTRQIGLYLIVLVSLLLSAVFFSLYYEHPAIEHLSWQTYDKPPLWGSETDFNVGRHFFSDFLVPYQWNQKPNPYLVDPPTNYLPVANSIFRLFGFLPYGLALTVFLSLGTTTLLGMLWYCSRGFSPIERASVVSIGLLSQGMIAAFDRGNIQIFAPVGLFFFSIRLLQGDSKQAGWIAGLMTTIKGYPAVLFALVVRQLKISRIALVISAVSGASTALLILFPGSIETTIQGQLKFAGFYGGDADVFWSLKTASFSSGIIQLSNVLFGVDSSITQSIQSSSLFMSCVILLWSLLIIVRKPNHNHLAKIVLTMSLFQFVIPMSFYYTKNWSIAAFALLLVRFRPGFESSETIHQSSLVERTQNAFIFLSLAPIWISGDSYNLGTVMCALALLVFLSVLTADGFNVRYLSDAHAKKF